MKKTNSKVGYCSKIEEIFVTALAAQITQTVKFMFSKDQLFIKLGATPTRVTIVKRSFRILFYFLFFAQLWGPIGNSHDAFANHGCRGVGRSENLGGGE